MRSLSERLLDLATALKADLRWVGAKCVGDVEEAALIVQTHGDLTAVTRSEERLAWDRYTAACTMMAYTVGGSVPPALIAAEADALLEERRKRFGAGK
jgi:hypothetical protein